MKRRIFLLICFCSACDQHDPGPSELPRQVIYRFDDHRYLELEGLRCEGALWYVDTKRKIRSEAVARDTPFFRISFFKYVHPSERYISIPWGDFSGFIVSKDYGRTWGDGRFSPGGGADSYAYGSDRRIPARESDYGVMVPAGEDTRPIRTDVVSMTVVNDQAFILTRWGDLYISSKPFDDPRLKPGGEGIPYTHKYYDGSLRHDRLEPGSSGMEWGWEYTSWNSVDGPKHWITDAYKPNWQNIPNKIPEVKNYTGWDHMTCDLDVGLPESKRRK
ncbi:hypothetical protein CHU32_00915 [Superficieibacter electus]|uniref:Tli3-like domain-containing protein n=1 Tax=Superficieibacter electus TaxID=2022662 RepID=A0A2P5GW10_9ENTR|nr:hypothetical protein CHU33_00915 [Superficieibacter electus]POP50748.1 hypothetical protein CHU32_00915 [Superficieibacter electus]